MISCWAKFFTCPEKKMEMILYRYLLIHHSNEYLSNSWILCIKKVLDLCGFSNIWSEQNYVNHKWISAVVKQRLQDQFIQKWFSDINGSSKGQIYRLFKTSFGFENYINMLPNKFRKIFIKFRTSNHHLPVETGRWYNVPLNERVCKLCNSGHTADEFHYILECKELANLRKKYLHTKYCTSPNIMKFSELMSNDNCSLLKKLCVFISKIYDIVG